jgi:hypothetical protein
VERAYIEKGLSLSPNIQLLGAIQKLDIVEAQKAIASGVRINDIHDFGRPLLFITLGYQVLSPDIKEWRIERSSAAIFVMAEFLIQNGLEIDAVDQNVVCTLENDMKLGMMTAAHYAAILNDHEGFDYLVRKGASLDAKDISGLTPQELFTQIRKIREELGQADGGWETTKEVIDNWYKLK